MRYVDPVGPVATPGKLAGDEERIGACNQCRFCLVQSLATADWSFLADGVGAWFQHQIARLDVLWAVAEALHDTDLELVFADVGNNAIHSGPVPGLEIQSQSANVGSLDERSFQRIAVNRPRSDTQHGGINWLQETRLSSQHGRPWPTGSVRGADEQKWELGEIFLVPIQHARLDHAAAELLDPVSNAESQLDLLFTSMKW